MSLLKSIEFMEQETQAELSGDYSKILEIIEPLAEQGDAEAQCYLAAVYHLDLGVTPDANTAITWYQLSA